MDKTLKQRKLVSIKGGGDIALKVEFQYRDELDLKKFGDTLSENILNNRNLEVVMDEGYPPVYNRNYVILEKSFRGQVQTAMQAFKKEYPEAVKLPGLIDHFFGTKKSKQWKEFMEKRFRLGDIIGKAYSCQIATFPGQQLIGVGSKIHTEEQLISELQQVAKSLDIELNK